MIETGLFGLSFILCLYIGVCDLRWGALPIWPVIVMIVAGAAGFLFIEPIRLLIGAGYLAFGLLLSKVGFWGEGDGWVLGGVGFCISAMLLPNLLMFGGLWGVWHKALKPKENVRFTMAFPMAILAYWIGIDFTWVFQDS